MNNKGFTLVELLATIVIISVIGGIATMSVISIINNSKERSEKIFIDKLETSIESYISLNGVGSEKVGGLASTFFKNDGKGSADREVKYSEYASVNLVKVKDGNNFINPKNKKNCFTGTGPDIRIFKDSDYVVYYYADLSDNSCNLNESNSIITNMPSSLCTSTGISC